MAEMLSTREVADLCGVSQRTVEKWRSEGGGPPFKHLGGSVRYDRADVEAWIAAQPSRRRDDGGLLSANDLHRLALDAVRAQERLIGQLSDSYRATQTAICEAQDGLTLLAQAAARGEEADWLTKAIDLQEAIRRNELAATFFQVSVRPAAEKGLEPLRAEAEQAWRLALYYGDKPPVPITPTPPELVVRERVKRWFYEATGRCVGINGVNAAVEVSPKSPFAGVIPRGSNGPTLVYAEWWWREVWRDHQGRETEAFVPWAEEPAGRA